MLLHQSSQNYQWGSAVALYGSHSVDGLVIPGNSWAAGRLTSIPSSSCWIRASARNSGPCPAPILLVVLALDGGKRIPIGTREMGERKVGEQNSQTNNLKLRLF